MSSPLTIFIHDSSEERKKGVRNISVLACFSESVSNSGDFEFSKPNPESVDFRVACLTAQPEQLFLRRLRRAFQLRELLSSIAVFSPPLPSGSIRHSTFLALLVD
jgi:hypothetical protein